MSAYTIGLYEKAMPKELTWKEKLKAAKEAGYDFVEISIDETDEKLARLEWTKEERLDLVKTMYEVGIPIRTMCLSGHRRFPIGSSDKAICARGMEIMEKAIQLAEDLGIRIIQLAGYDVYYDESTPETVERFGENLKKCTLMAAKSGVIMGFETMETEFMNTCQKAMNYVNKINSVYLSVYPDCGNINNAAITYGIDVLEDLRSCDGHIVAMHLKETEPGKFRDMMYGEGQVNFPAMIDTAWKMGVRKFVTEFWYLGKENWKDDLAYANKTMRTLLDKEEKTC
ncbi:MAG: L-ribulose-5-phosphate 3-epimerase [Lachnospiraceae bacterium]|jgi:L-ribulose-5-phosphate 3-epimerase|nr:L-ribulose-5-phosphate 3-epimerase [Lachnospiraceae bacterium]